MYNVKDIQFAGKHDYDKESAKDFATSGVSTFSVNIFKWGLMSSGKRMKRLKCVVRVVGVPAEMNKVFEYCENIVKLLDSGDWDGRKTVRV